MKISVLTVVLNRVATVGEAIRSVQRQTHAPLEHVIQDGGSTDGTLEIVTRLSTGVTRVESAPDRGIYDAINRAISRATGNVVGLMHSDDVYAHERVLEKVAAAFADPSVDGVYGDLVYVSARDPARVLRYWKSGGYDPARVARGWAPPHPTLYLRREVFERWGAYDTRYRIAADYDAMLRWLVTGRIRLAYIPEVLVRMRVGGESNRSFTCFLTRNREDFEALRRNRVGGLGTLALKKAQKVSQFLVRE